MKPTPPSKPARAPGATAGRLNDVRADGLFQEGLRWHQQGQWARAAQLYQQALSLNPNHYDALHLSGVAAAQAGDLPRAVQRFERALQVDPSDPAAHNNLGNALLALERYDEAMASYERALALKPDYPEALYNRASVLKKLERLDEALAGYDRAIALRPDYAEAHCNRGTVLQALKRFDDALAAYRRAIALAPNWPETYNNLGGLLLALRKFDEAMQCLDKALALGGDHPAVHVNRGKTLHELGRYAEALASLDRAIALDPREPEAYFSSALALRELGRHADALARLRVVLELEPNHGLVHSIRLGSETQICDWSHWNADLLALERAVREGSKRAPSPFPLLALYDDPQLHQLAARAFSRELLPSAQAPAAAIGPRTAGSKIRVGYFSADFHNHATMQLMARLFEVHDRARFEWTAFSFGPPIDDAERRRAVRAFDRFIDVRQMSDREVAQQSRDLQIDIAVDLKGITKDARQPIFAERAAPIQVNYLGYPGTMGASYIDYLLGDATVTPPEAWDHYDEKIVVLPHSYQVNDPTRVVSAAAFSRRQMGLPDDGFVFCCFNNNYKIVPAVFDVWMRILQRVPGSVLWLLHDNATAANNLRREAAARCVEPRRLVFAGRVPPADHLARQRLADLFLDTWPYNAHTTASDALWGGLPLLTCMGRSFASRVGASLLRAVGLPELVTETWADYEALAVALATDRRAELDALRARLASNRLSEPLFDAERFARHLEAAYVAMVERHRAGLPPEHLAVAEDATVTIAV